MRDLGETCGKHRVARLLKLEGLRSQTGYRSRPGMRGDKPAVVAPNHLQRQFTVTQPNQSWGTDITYIRTHEGWLYLGTARMKSLDHETLIEAGYHLLDQRRHLRRICDIRGNSDGLPPNSEISATTSSSSEAAARQLRPLLRDVRIVRQPPCRSPSCRR